MKQFSKLILDLHENIILPIDLLNLLIYLNFQIYQITVTLTKEIKSIV